MPFRYTISGSSGCTNIVSIHLLMTVLLVAAIASRSSSSLAFCLSSFSTTKTPFWGGIGATATAVAAWNTPKQPTPAFIHIPMMPGAINHNRRKRRKSSVSTAATADDDIDKKAQEANNQQKDEEDRPTQYFLMKSEPSEFSVYDLQTKCGPEMEENWDGVRNYQARNIMRSMKYGDIAFFYHSSCKIPAIVGTMRIVSQTSFPDITALDPSHKGYDNGRSTTLDDCRWDCVRVQLEQIYEEPITLSEIKQHPKDGNDIIVNMKLLRNTRLSVQDLTKEEYDAIEQIRLEKTSN